MVEHDVTLGGGIKAGSYTEQGEVLDIHECVELCCKEKRCDVAMVIKDICYTVACYEPKKCVSVPVRRIQYHPSLVHVRRVKRGSDVSSRIDHESIDNENEGQDEKKSALEDELMDLLTEQSLREHDRPGITKGKYLRHTIIYYC